MYGSYREALGDNLLVLPLPDFGNGMRTGQGSWAWGITRACRNPRAATRFLTFLLQTHEVLAMADANGAVPATRSAIAQSALYRPHGPLNLFARQLLEGYAVPRPRTPGYPVISAAFARAFRDIRDGADVQGALDRAARSIDRDIADNHGYPVPEHLRAR
jgi:multiple sugar transport system substrate-binding protein